MIITNVIGGLGNQMFQYSCGYALSIDSGATLKIATDMLTEYPCHHGLWLHQVFSTSSTAADFRDIKNLLGGWRARPKVRRWLGHEALKMLRGQRFVVEREPTFNEELLRQVRYGLYLQGYWQSERYFKQHANAIRNEFTFRTKLDGHNAELARQIKKNTSVSLHIRRGDYADSPKTLNFHGLCSIEYYDMAVAYIRKRLPRFRLYAFSDDPEWVTKTLKPRYSELVVIEQNKEEKSHNDMHLMSLCNHHIIANSSFSWWGAWLNPDKNKIVIAPHKWFSNGLDSADLVPQNWIRI